MPLQSIIKYFKHTKKMKSGAEPYTKEELRKIKETEDIGNSIDL